MRIFDPYDKTESAMPGLNTGSAPDVSTLSSSPASEAKVNYRSGGLAGVATAFGLTCLLLGFSMFWLAVTWDGLCRQGDLSATVCASSQSAILTLIGLVPSLGWLMAAIIGSLAKRRKNGAALIGLLLGLGLATFALTQFTAMIGLGQ
ncbi:MAG: hypothetical protein ACK5KU_03490 [Beutenbergiaceae bacterium]